MNLMDFLFIYSPDPTASSKTNKKGAIKMTRNRVTLYAKYVGFSSNFCHG